MNDVQTPAAFAAFAKLMLEVMASGEKVSGSQLVQAMRDQAAGLSRQGESQAAVQLADLADWLAMREDERSAAQSLMREPSKGSA